MTEHEKRRMQEMIGLLNEASEAYYGGRDEIMSNFEWDELFSELSRLEAETGVILPDSPTQKVNITAKDNVSGKKIARAYPVLSQAKKKKVAGKCIGLTFVITGALYQFRNRDAFRDYVEANGGRVACSVSKRTDFLVNNDVSSTSAKNTKARELGIPILSEEDFVERFGNNEIDYYTAGGTNMKKCEYCGKTFDPEVEMDYFESETGGLPYCNLRKQLCGKCAVQAIDDGDDGVYFETCESCEREFDLAIAEGIFDEQCPRVAHIDGLSLRDLWRDKILCDECALEKAIKLYHEDNDVEDFETDYEGGDAISVYDAADIWASHGKDEDYMFGYTEDELEDALNS